MAWLYRRYRSASSPPNQVHELHTCFRGIGRLRQSSSSRHWQHSQRQSIRLCQAPRNSPRCLHAIPRNRAVARLGPWAPYTLTTYLVGVPGLEHRLPITRKSGTSMSLVQHTPAPLRNALVPTRSLAAARGFDSFGEDSVSCQTCSARFLPRPRGTTTRRGAFEILSGKGILRLRLARHSLFPLQVERRPSWLTSARTTGQSINSRSTGSDVFEWHCQLNQLRRV